MELKFAFDQNSNFQKKLDEVYQATGNLTLPLDLIARDWYKGNRSIFALKGPGRYKDLTEKYKKQKEKKWGYVYPILKASGKLSRSITNRSDINTIYRIENKKNLILGTKVPYGIYHQSDKPRTKMPYRPFLLIGVEQIAPNDIKQNRINNWIKILDSYFQQKMNK